MSLLKKGACASDANAPQVGAIESEYGRPELERSRLLTLLIPFSAVMFVSPPCVHVTILFRRTFSRGQDVHIVLCLESRNTTKAYIDAVRTLALFI